MHKLIRGQQRFVFRDDLSELVIGAYRTAAAH